LELTKYTIREELKMLSMKEAIENYVEGCVGKVDCPEGKSQSDNLDLREV
jgi:hypothetical protein